MCLANNTVASKILVTNLNGVIFEKKCIFAALFLEVLLIAYAVCVEI